MEFQSKSAACTQQHQKDEEDGSSRCPCADLVVTAVRDPDGVEVEDHRREHDCCQDGSECGRFLEELFEPLHDLVARDVAVVGCIDVGMLYGWL